MLASMDSNSGSECDGIYEPLDAAPGKNLKPKNAASKVWNHLKPKKAQELKQKKSKKMKKKRCARKKTRRSAASCQPSTARCSHGHA